MFFFFNLLKVLTVSTNIYVDSEQKLTSCFQYYSETHVFLMEWSAKCNALIF